MHMLIGSNFQLRKHKSAALRGSEFEAVMGQAMSHVNELDYTGLSLGKMAGLDLGRAWKSGSCGEPGQESLARAPLEIVQFQSYNGSEKGPPI